MNLEGRWTIFVCTGCELATGRHKDCDALREATPVVPCDEAAVERAAAALAECNWRSGSLTITDRMLVEAVLRAAGEQP